MPEPSTKAEYVVGVDLGGTKIEFVALERQALESVETRRYWREKLHDLPSIELPRRRSGAAVEKGAIWHTVPIASVTELTSKEIVVGATTPGTTMVDFPLLVNDVLGYKFRVVRGYQGTPQINLAIERGEVQGMGGLGWASVKAQTPHWIAEKKIKVLAQYGLTR